MVPPRRSIKVEATSIQKVWGYADQVFLNLLIIILFSSSVYLYINIFRRAQYWTVFVDKNNQYSKLSEGSDFFFNCELGEQEFEHFHSEIKRYLLPKIANNISVDKSAENYCKFLNISTPFRSKLPSAFIDRSKGLELSINNYEFSLKAV